jgi:Zn-dependent peptidase ImmA (M78 family)
MNQLVVEKQAAQFRAELGLSNTESIQLRSLLLKLEVLTVFKPLDMDVSGIAIKAGVNNRFMLVNTARTLGHQHFTICHELYHLFFQANFNYQVCQVGKFDKKSKEEFFADLFAAKFLVPEEGIVSLIPNHELDQGLVSLGTILKLEQYFSCSRKALLNRLLELKLIRKKEEVAYSTQVQAHALHYGYSTKLYEKDLKVEVIGDYGNMAKKLFDQHRISESHYLELLEDIGINFLDLGKDEEPKE